MNGFDGYWEWSDMECIKSCVQLHGAKWCRAMQGYAGVRPAGSTMVDDRQMQEHQRDVAAAVFEPNKHICYMFGCYISDPKS
jgi:hypothetical protein